MTEAHNVTALVLNPVNCDSIFLYQSVFQSNVPNASLHELRYSVNEIFLYVDRLCWRKRKLFIEIGPISNETTCVVFQISSP